MEENKFQEITDKIKKANRNYAKSDFNRRMLYKSSRKNKVKFNDELFERDHYKIVDYLKKYIMGIERLNSAFLLKIRGFTLIEDYKTIKDMQQKIFENDARNNHGFRENIYECINLKDSDVMLLVVSYTIKGNNARNCGNIYMNVDIPIYVPRFVKKYYFRIKGVLYAPSYQILDGTTYNFTTKKGDTFVVFKSIYGPLEMIKNTSDLTDVKGNSMEIKTFNVRVFSKSSSAEIFALANMGLEDAIKFYKLDDCLKVCTFDEATAYDDSHYLKFSIGCDRLIVVYKTAFEEFEVVQSFIDTIAKSVWVKEPYESFKTHEYWTLKLSEVYSTSYKKSSGKVGNTINSRKGLGILQSIENYCDVVTQEKIALPDEEKQSIYHILRFMSREFDELSGRNSMWLYNKRLRLYEYIASIYVEMLSKKLLRIIDKPLLVANSQIMQCINIPADALIDYISTNSIIESPNLPNDNDGRVALKCTFKGPGGVGSDSSNNNNKRKSNTGNNYNVPKSSKIVNRSQIGKVCHLSSPKTSPGLSGQLVPQLVLDDNGYIYDNFKEPNGFYEKYRGRIDDINEKLLKSGDTTIESHTEDITPDVTKIKIIDKVYYRDLVDPDTFPILASAKDDELRKDFRPLLDVKGYSYPMDLDNK